MFFLKYKFDFKKSIKLKKKEKNVINRKNVFLSINTKSICKALRKKSEIIQ